MKRNTGLIGAARYPNRITGAPGIHDTFDAYNSRKGNAWPLVKRVVSISPSTGFSVAYNEGSSFNVNITTEGFEDTDVLYYTIVASSGTISTGDFSDGLLSGSITLTNNIGFFSKTLTFDGTSEVDDSFVIQIRTESTSGPIQITSGVVTINNPTFTVTPSTSSFNEGSSITWNVTTTNINNGQVLYFSYGGTPANSGDISSALTGSFIINNNTGSFITTAVNDLTTEGDETLTAYVRVGSTGGTIVAQNTVIINDTSLTPAAAVTPTVTSIDEGSSVTFNVSTTNYPSGTLYYTVENVSNFESADLNSTSGSFSISSSAGSFTLTATSDGFTEGTEQFLVRIRLQSASGTILATSSTITINDTSTGIDESQGFDLSAAFYPISQYVNSDGLQNTTKNYSVSEVQSGYSGTGSLYLIHKATGSTTFYNDAPVACIQILDSSGSTVTQQWWFGASGNGQGWTTSIIEVLIGGVGAGITITPSQASTSYTYTTSVVNGAIADRFCLATTVTSAQTGAADGIAQPTGPMTLGEQAVPQAIDTYYMFRETSGAQVGYSCLCRSPSRTWTAGERIRIAYIIGNVSTANYYNAADTFFVGIA